jgi:aminoglycoside phosphotransferase (APT) family kinase protein
MGALTARLHSGPTPPGFGTWARGCSSLLEDHETATVSLIKMAEGSDLIGPVALAQLTSQLFRLRESLSTAPAMPVLAHRDVQARNLLVDDAGRVCALLDFETAAGGDPAEDFSPIGLDWVNQAFAAFCAGYAGAGGRLDQDAPARVAHRLLGWVLVIFAYLGHIAPIYLEPARRAWDRIEAGELPALGPVLAQ